MTEILFYILYMKQLGDNNSLSLTDLGQKRQLFNYLKMFVLMHLVWK